MLAQPYQKITPLHIFIEDLIGSIAFEQHNDLGTKKPWIDFLFESNDIALSFKLWQQQSGGDIEDYFEHLSAEGVVAEVAEIVAKQVFHVLFADRSLLRDFGDLCRY
jgi:hypothetical protein